MRWWIESKQRVINRVVEAINAFLVVWTVLVIWIIWLYYNVFLIEIQDILGWQTETLAVVESFGNERTGSKKSHSVAYAYENETNNQNILDDIVAEKESSSWFWWLYKYDLTDYLGQSLGEYDMPFTTVPPGRFIVIPSIWVQAPISDIPYASEEKIKTGNFDEELRDWVVKYPHTTAPWKIWNTLIFGHSSVDALQAPKEDFWFIFYKLPKLNNGDLIQVIRDWEVHEYRVEKKIIKWPKDVPDIVNESVDKDILTLMACYPLMSDAQRILIQAVPVE